MRYGHFYPYTVALKMYLMMPFMYVNGCPLLCSILATADKAVIVHGFTVTRDTATVAYWKVYYCY
jgi:hypothetical protein